ncbi:MAG: metal-dependent phosphohydrolase [Treponema sp.]|jgi:HD-GYP domain-containing protein (c-di-GMP phosphodiesterase class II)|nr:metal-dependent phosphohydrolase [Treponema sp.]
MGVNGITIPLSYVLSPEGKDINKAYVDIILEAEIPVLCVNKAARKQRLMPFKVLYGTSEKFWQRGGGWDYFLTGESLDIIKEKTGADFISFTPSKPKPPEKKPEVEQGFGSKHKVFVEMPIGKRIEQLDKNKQRLTEILEFQTKRETIITEALVDTTIDAALINHSVLLDALRLTDEEAKKLTQDLVDSTFEMVKSSVNVISEQIFNNELMNTLVQKSNGTIVQHMTRVYLTGISFLSYYHNLVSTSRAIQKLRMRFSTKYRKYYLHLLPHIFPEDVVLERVFFGGMRAFTFELYYKWAVGFLIHDIGKAAAVEYHEGEAKYDRETVVEHVKLGYKNIMEKTNYPKEACLITGYHHEYYGDPDGYGYFRAYLQQYKKSNPDAKQDFCMTYDLEPMVDYKAIAYFPAKVLEIIDIFDSLTDPMRVYRKPMSPDEALVMMREQFIDKQYKIDVILFDIFVDFINERDKPGYKRVYT